MQHMTGISKGAAKFYFLTRVVVIIIHYYLHLLWILFLHLYDILLYNGKFKNPGKYDTINLCAYEKLYVCVEKQTNENSSWAVGAQNYPQQLKGIFQNWVGHSPFPNLWGLKATGWAASLPNFIQTDEGRKDQFWSWLLDVWVTFCLVIIFDIWQFWAPPFTAQKCWQGTYFWRVHIFL